MFTVRFTLVGSREGKADVGEITISGVLFGGLWYCGSGCMAPFEARNWWFKMVTRRVYGLVFRRLGTFG